MDIEHTRRGFALTRFNDLDGAACSIQDSSIASEACIWMGVSKHADGTDGERMHLTVNMALRVARGLRAFADGATDGINAAFTDRYGCECAMTLRSDGRMDLGVLLGDRADAGPSTMRLDRPMAARLLPPLLAFAGGGSIQSDDAHDLGAIEEPVHLDVKIPPSMLHRTEIGGTGVSARALVDALLDLLDGEDVESLRGTVGHDLAEHLVGLRKDISVLRAD